MEVGKLDHLVLSQNTDLIVIPLDKTFALKADECLTDIYVGQPQIIGDLTLGHGQTEGIGHLMVGDAQSRQEIKQHVADPLLCAHPTHGAQHVDQHDMIPKRDRDEQSRKPWRFPKDFIERGFRERTKAHILDRAQGRGRVFERDIGKPDNVARMMDLDDLAPAIGQVGIAERPTMLDDGVVAERRPEA